MYLIKNMCHAVGPNIADAHSFSIDLFPAVPGFVADSGVTQENVNHLIQHEGRRWLDASGFDAMVDPDDHRFPLEREEEPIPLGPNAYPLYDPRIAIRVSWGEWGPEHLTVPGSACGLDIDRGFGLSAYDGGRCLLPHNIDHWGQKYLLLIVFTELMAITYEQAMYAKRREKKAEDVKDENSQAAG